VARSLKLAAHSLKLVACKLWLAEKSIELNVWSPSFAGFCQFNLQIQTNCCLDAKTGSCFSHDSVSLKLKTEAKRLYSLSVRVV
jgi:hypothetical protein